MHSPTQHTSTTTDHPGDHRPSKKRSQQNSTPTQRTPVARSSSVTGQGPYAILKEMLGDQITYMAGGTEFTL